MRARAALRALLACGLLAGTLSACSSGSDGPAGVYAGVDARKSAADAAARAVSRPSGTASAAACSPAAAASYPPLSSLPSPGSMPSGSLEAQIAARGYLVVGVSGDTRLLGARNSLAGGRLEGFDIDMARVVAKAIFGSDSDDRIHFKVITAADRFPQVNEGVDKGGVDLVARAVSATCGRWSATDSNNGSAFSAAYFTSAQRLLVRSDLVTDKHITQVEDLVAQHLTRICAPKSSTSEAVISRISGVSTVSVDIHSDCMALWQQGRVDAITGDDAILAGFKAQDPHAQVIGRPLDVTPYVLAVARAHKEFVQFVNAVLAGAAAKQAWSASYGTWLAGSLGEKAMPAPDYSRPLSWTPAA